MIFREIHTGQALAGMVRLTSYYNTTFCLFNPQICFLQPQFLGISELGGCYQYAMHMLLEAELVLPNQTMRVAVYCPPDRGFLFNVISYFYSACHVTVKSWNPPLASGVTILAGEADTPATLPCDISEEWEQVEKVSLGSTMPISDKYKWLLPAAEGAKNDEK
jgi:hypothetical protein